MYSFFTEERLKVEQKIINTLKKRRLIYFPVKMDSGRPDKKFQIIQIYAKY